MEAGGGYRYDASFRLVEATGREHLGQGLPAPQAPGHGDGGRRGRPHPEDQLAMGRYRERYRYDEVGNLLSMEHRVLGGGGPGGGGPGDGAQGR